MTLPELIPLLLGGSMGLTCYAIARAIALFRRGTDDRQDKLMDDLEVGRLRQEHNAGQWENQARDAWEHIRKLEIDHRACEVEVPIYRRPPWASYVDPREKRKRRSADDPTA